jgi:glycolate oxidase iron-sulfur subunit
MPSVSPAIDDRTAAANLSCIHCGLCLAVCPTYLQLGSEADSPRGRIYLVNALEEGRIAPTGAALQKHLYRCLECRACETVCPSGVRYSVIMNGARENIRAPARPGALERLLRWLVFEAIFPNVWVMHLSFRLLRLYQRSGLQKFVRASRVLKLFPGVLERMESLLPEVPKSPSLHLPERAVAGRRGRVSLFEGCIMPELFGPVHEATVRVLERNDVSVCLPRNQGCCGALHLHDGELSMARALARRNIQAFEKNGADFVIVNAAGCGAMLKEYSELLRDDPAWRARAASFSSRVRDISEYLNELGIAPPAGRLDLKVTYDDPCHLLHAQGIGTPPRKLLRSIPGLEFVESRDADRCCGSAGVYNITHPELSALILEDKIANLAASGADVVATGNPGCLLQIRAGLSAHGIRMEVAHPVELLDRSYREGS